jgi:hypothetical protein
LPRNTFLIFGDRRYPAKFIRGLAYKIAAGEVPNPSTDYSGGMETARFFLNRGFNVEYRGTVMRATQPRELGPCVSLPRSTHNHGERKTRADAQRKALRNLLEQLFGSVQTEAVFDWLVVPQRREMDQTLSEIAEVLASIRGYSDFFVPGEYLRCDFFVPENKLIIEYDERQHFTLARAAALSHYPANLPIGFDRNVWLSACETIRASDQTPSYRDEQRAFYDSLRDILASRRGYTVVRIKDKEYDWTMPNAMGQLTKLLNRVTRSDTELRDRTFGIETGETDAKTRIVSVCVLGQQAASIRENSQRERFLQQAIDVICHHDWCSIDAVLLPGGFFCLDKYVGPLPFADRVAVLERATFHVACVDGCRRLGVNSPGALIVVGIDTTEGPTEWPWAWGDQLCVAWSEQRGIVGIGRKVFPVKPPKDQKYDEKRDESLHYVCYATDYGDEKRVVALPSGRTAILCACYDMFGCAEKVDSPTTRTASIVNLHDGNRLRRANKELSDKPPRQDFNDLRKSCVDEFQKLLVTENVSVGLACIHKFDRPNSEGYWQRHGIQACSAVLQNGLAVGAAHFDKSLPDVDKSTLAAVGIPATYLSKKPFSSRKIDMLKPTDGVSAHGLLIRLFEL